MQSLRICIENAIENPDHLTREGVIEKDSRTVDCQDLDIFSKVETEKYSPSKDLNNFQLKPPHLKEQELFEHMIKYRELHSEGKKASK